MENYGKQAKILNLKLKFKFSKKKKKLMQKGAMQKNRENPKMAFNCEIQIQFALCNFLFLQVR